MMLLVIPEEAQEHLRAISDRLYCSPEVAVRTALAVLELIVEEKDRGMACCFVNEETREAKELVLVSSIGATGGEA